MCYAEGPITSLSLTVSGEVDVQDTAGVVRAPEHLPAAVYLRSTPLTEPDQHIRALAEDARAPGSLPSLHRLMEALHLRFRFDVGTTDAATAAATAFSAGHGVCQDFAHIFCSAARTLGIPARYVSGHLAKTDLVAQDASHAWAEAYVEDFGWVAFDPANGICATEAYLRIAIGLDYLDAAPVRGARRGGGSETMSVRVQARDAKSQRQS
jgi:transglutaminase-like putative cysteine protease